MGDWSSARIKVRNRASSIVRTAGPKLVTQVQAVTPVKSGETMRGWTYDLTGGADTFGVTIRNPVERAAWLNDSPAHAIRPRPPNKRLRFRLPGGEVVFARMVMHPGVHLHFVDATLTADLWHSLLVLSQLEAPPG